MADAPRDGNNVPTKLACLYSDTVQGTNLVPLSITADGLIRINEVDVAAFTLQPVAPKDQNYVNVWLFEGTDGLTYPAVADEFGRLLVDRA